MTKITQELRKLHKNCVI